MFLKLFINVFFFKLFFVECDNFMIVYGVFFLGVGGEVRCVGLSFGWGNCVVFLYFIIMVFFFNEVYKWVLVN